MAYVLVVLVAAAVGAAAFRATLRQSVAPTADAGTASAQPIGVPVPGPGQGRPQTYVPVTNIRASWESRLTGALGLVIAIVVGAVSLALATYLGFSFLAKLINRSVG